MKQLLVFILLAGLICWLMFAPIYKHVAIMRQALLQQEVDYMLEIGTNGMHGYIDSAMLEQSRQRLEARGFDPQLIEYEVSTNTGANASHAAAPVMRGTGIRLYISYPYQRLFMIDRLIGLSGGPGPYDRMAASGMKMSEYVPLGQ